MNTPQELAESAFNINSADPEVRQRERAAQGAYYERMLAALTPQERREKVVETGQFLLLLPPERLTAHVAEMSEETMDVWFSRVLVKLIRCAIRNNDLSAITTILKSTKNGPHRMNIDRIGPWSEALIDVFSAHRQAVELIFTPCIEIKPDLSWQGYLKLLHLTAADSREESIIRVGESHWLSLGWLFHLNVAGKLADEILSSTTKEWLTVNFLIAAKTSFRSSRVINAFIRSHTSEQMRAMFLRVHPHIEDKPAWRKALEMAIEVIINELPPFGE